MKMWKERAEWAIMVIASLAFGVFLAWLTSPDGAKAQPGTSVFGGNGGTGGGGTNNYNFDASQFTIGSSTNVSAKSGVNVTNLADQGTQTINILQPTNYPTFGSPNAMNNNQAYVVFYTCGNTNLATVENAGLDSEVRFISPHAFNSGSAIGFGWVGTNQTYTNLSTFFGVLMTNADGKIIYGFDPHAMGIGFTPDGGISNNIPSGGFIVMNNTNTFSLCRVTTVGGVTGNYPYLQWDGKNGVLHITKDTTGVNSWTNARAQDLATYNTAGGLGGGTVTNFGLDIVNNFRVNGNYWALRSGSTNTIDGSMIDPTSLVTLTKVTYTGAGGNSGTVPLFEMTGTGTGIGAAGYDLDLWEQGTRIFTAFTPGDGIATFLCACFTNGIPIGFGGLPTANCSIWTQSNIVDNANLQVNGSYIGTANFTGNINVIGTTLNVQLTNGLVIGASTNTASFTLVATNFISGQVYNNLTGRPIYVSATCFETVAAVAGYSSVQLRMTGTGGATNIVSEQSTTSAIAESYTNVLSGYVPAGGTFTFTNISSGTGNSAGVVSGSGQYMVY